MSMKSFFESINELIDALPLAAGVTLAAIISFKLLQTHTIPIEASVFGVVILVFWCRIWLRRIINIKSLKTKKHTPPTLP